MLLLTLLSTAGTVILSVLLAMLIWRDFTSQLMKWIAIAMLGCLAAGTLMGFPGEWGGSQPLRLTMRFIGMPLTGLAWWLALCLLDDNFKLRGLAWTGMVATLVPALIFWFEDAGYEGFVFAGSGYLNPVIFSLLLLHVLYVGLWGLKDDLVRFRREARLWLAVLLIAGTVLSITSGYIFEGQFRDFLSSTTIFIGLAAMLLWLAQLKASALEFSTPDPAMSPEHAVPAKDKAAYERLMQLMNDDKTYLDPALSVPKLAALVGVPPHQLRALINNRLGFRNFTAFLASYRLADVKRALSDPDHAGTPILTIALDAGFASFATFNRTFKIETGQTAGEYRKAVLGIA